MKDKIEKELPAHTITSKDAPKMYIADYKKSSNGQRGVELSEVEPAIGYVLLNNESRVSIYFDGFKESALPLANGNNSKQCEGVVFPVSCDERDWVLFIECKYAYEDKQAKDPENKYPETMIDQIIATVDYFRSKGILGKNRIVSAIAAFPNLKGTLPYLKENFDGWFFMRIKSPDLIVKDHKIRIRATNFATVVHSGFIKLGYS